MKLKTLFLALVLCFNSYGTIIVGEEEKTKFLKVDQVGENYQFSECMGSYSNPVCEPLFDGNITFTRWDIKEMAEEKYEDALLAGAADVGIIIGAAIGGLLLGAKATVLWATTSTTAISLDGGVAAAGGFLVSVGTTTTAGIAEVAFDALDPFVHRDAAIAASAIVDDADEGDLDDVDAEVVNGEKVVFIEDVKYSQVRDTFKGMLEDIIEDKGYDTTNNKIEDNGFSLF